MKELRKSVNIWRNCGQKFEAYFLAHPVGLQIDAAADVACVGIDMLHSNRPIDVILPPDDQYSRVYPAIHRLFAAHFSFQPREAVPC